MDKKLIPFIICGVFAWLTLASAFIYLWIIDRPQAATTEQTFVSDDVPAISSTRRFDILTAAEQDTFNFIFESELNKDVNESVEKLIADSGLHLSLKSGVECGKDIVYYYVDTDSASFISKLMTPEVVDSFMDMAEEMADFIYEITDKRIDYGYLVYYKGKLELSSTGSGREYSR